MFKGEKVKSNLNVRWDENLGQFLIVDISPFILRLFGIEGTVEGMINNPIVLPTLVSYLNLVKNSTIHFIEFLYDIDDLRYTVKIVEEKDCYTIIFESLFCNVKDIGITEPIPDIDDTFLHDVEGLFTNDKTISEIFALRNATQENVELEILYIVKKVQEQLEEWKTEYQNKSSVAEKRLDDFEDEYIKEKDLDFYYVLGKVGIKRLIILLFVLSIIETTAIEPFITPIINQMKESVTNVIDD